MILPANPTMGLITLMLFISLKFNIKNELTLNENSIMQLLIMYVINNHILF